MNREELDAELASRRIILLDDDINDEMASTVSFWLLAFNLQSNENINLLINTNGGEVKSSFSIYDLIKLSHAPVTGLVIGDCKSMGVIILQACNVRLATEHSIFYIHELNWGGNKFILDDDAERLMKEKIEELKRTREKIINVLTGRPKLTREKALSLMNKGENNNTHLLADQALELGLIDKIVEKYPLFE